MATAAVSRSPTVVPRVLARLAGPSSANHSHAPSGSQTSPATQVAAAGNGMASTEANAVTTTAIATRASAMMRRAARSPPAVAIVWVGAGILYLFGRRVPFCSISPTSGQPVGPISAQVGRGRRCTAPGWT